MSCWLKWMDENGEWHEREVQPISAPGVRTIQQMDDMMFTVNRDTHAKGVSERDRELFAGQGIRLDSDPTKAVN